jgi:hypothetical protein
MRAEQGNILKRILISSDFLAFVGGRKILFFTQTKRVMSLLLRNWLISDLNTRLDLNLSIEHQFSTGYRFGKLLEKLGVEDEGCKKYVNSDAVDALIINFCGLEQSLREKLHVKLSPQAALDVISQKPGAAQKLLYEIKSVISSSSKKCISKTTTKSCPYDSYPSSPVGNL